MRGPGYSNEFVVVNGDGAGTRIVIPPGTATIGSEEGSRIRLAASGVSRRHAEVTSLDGRTILADKASRNGSWVNGHPVMSPTELADGDLVQFGEVRLRFLDPNADNADDTGGPSPVEYASGGHGSAGDSKGSTGGGQTTAPPAVRPKERLGTALVFAAAINLVGLFGNTLTAFLTEVTPTWTWFATPVVALAVALVTETLGHYRKGGSAEPPARPDDPHRPPVRRRPLAVTLLVTLLLLGGGGWLVTAAVSNAVAYSSGNETGVQRLESQVATELQGVTVTILGVQTTSHFTRVEIRVNNGTSSSLSLPLFQTPHSPPRTEPPSMPTPSAAAGSPKSLLEESGREPSTLRASCRTAQPSCRSTSSMSWPWASTDRNLLRFPTSR